MTGMTKKLYSFIPAKSLQGFSIRGFIPSMNSIWYKVMSPLPEKTVEKNEPAA